MGSIHSLLPFRCRRNNFNPSRKIIREYANRWWVNLLVYLSAAITVALNGYLLYQVFSGNS